MLWISSSSPTKNSLIVLMPPKLMITYEINAHLFVFIKRYIKNISYENKCFSKAEIFYLYVLNVTLISNGAHTVHMYGKPFKFVHQSLLERYISLKKL